MKQVFMVAEKPSLALSLAKILSDGKCSSRKGFNGSCSVHEFIGKFPPSNEQVQYKFTSVCGHVMSIDFIGKYNNWDKVDPVELYSCPTEKKESTPKLMMPKFLEKEGRGCDYIVLWLDCDKEGENICFEVLDVISPVMKKTPNRQTVYRAKFSAITDVDIKKAMTKLVQPNKNESLSVDARQELDLRIGCAFTRFQTKFFQGKYGDLDSTLISYGPCQTPTLGFCVERHDKIQAFKPEAYWVLKALIKHSEGKKIALDWSRVRLFDKEVMQMFYNLLKQYSTATVTNVSQKEKAKSRPQALNTVEMLRVASSVLGIGPQHTMVIAEKLYVQGYISYPRTETNEYADSFDLRGALKQQVHSPIWGDYVGTLLSQGISKPKRGVNVGDHPPITPMRAASESELGHDNWRIYDFITRHFIASISPDCRYVQTNVSLAVGDEQFSCVGKVVIEPGFTTILRRFSMDDEDVLPKFQKGDVCSISELKIEDRQTSPPGYLTEAELITLMEKHRIGTDASIPVHINNVCERNYVTVGAGRKLIPTTLGIVLVHGYQKIDRDLVRSTMRAAVEEQLELIAAGKVQFQVVLDHALDIFRRKFCFFVEHIGSMDELFEVSFTSLAETGRPMSRCGKCKRYMKYIDAKPVRLHCAKCDETYSLPAGGSIRTYKEAKCPLDEFDLLYWTAGIKGKSYVLCPYCYNNPPFSGMKKGMGCNECRHATCIMSMERAGISECVECSDGVLVLDDTCQPKFRLVCNQCETIINLFDRASKVLVSQEICENCQSAMIDVTFTEKKNPLPNGETQRAGCVFCDNVFSSLVKITTASSSSFRGKGRGRMGRGRGRGGRMRGRGRSRPPKDKMAQLDAYFL